MSYLTPLHLGMLFLHLHNLIFLQENSSPHFAPRMAKPTWLMLTVLTSGLTLLPAGASWAIASNARFTAGSFKEKMENASASHMLKKVNIPQIGRKHPQKWQCPVCPH